MSEVVDVCLALGVQIAAATAVQSHVALQHSSVRGLEQGIPQVKTAVLHLSLNAEVHVPLFVSSSVPELCSEVKQLALERIRTHLK